MKTCAVCGVNLAFTSYTKSSKTFDGLDRNCRACKSKQFKEWRLKNREYNSERRKIWGEENYEERLGYDRGRYARDPHVKARRLIQAMVARGKLPVASDCACTDCGLPASDYDHTASYQGEDAYKVEPVCRPCHLRRTEARKCHSSETLESGLTMART